MSSIPLYLAFGAGIVSFLSPCILPLVPGYLSYLAGVSVTADSTEINRRQLISRALLFNLGFILVFISLGVTGSYLGKVLLTYKPVLTKIGGIFIFLMGLHMTGILKWSTLYRTYKFHNNSPVTGPLGALLLGVTFAAGWTPCVGPVLGSILVYAGMSGTVSKGVLLLGVYSLGLAIPFMLAAISLSWTVKYLPRISKYLPYISLVSGIVLMIVGGLLFFDIFSRLSAYLTF
ncbi:cytochrome c biogenesis protein, transmembrane region [Desulforamulus reducens MI-1]|uniref:Cytochrome c biogenesis protein, transmembrane region n=1 Tax=Desulforamulus reducens (strain ATCC BAA-1160 / DSM 100696 / MI-1) TaxID=349161 RepID=A4J4Q8_DESRM|nr:cytochrome c biogenesis protein CcdA [Desulforamulus reducens]ABO50061.1 cytochrome c biogenesis protein, transmembrane region [Desulforamulus reducens MI-1]